MHQEPQEFERLVRAYRNRIYTFSCYHLSNEEDAQDVTQAVLVKLWNHWERLEAEHIWHWLIRVTRNACIDAIRRRKSYRNLVPEDLDASGAKEAVSAQPSPHAVAETLDFQECLEECLARLSEPQKSILILREIQGLKYEEISEVLDLPLNTIKVYLHRGRRALREHIKEYVTS